MSLLSFVILLSIEILVHFRCLVILLIILQCHLLRKYLRLILWFLNWCLLNIVNFFIFNFGWVFLSKLNLTFLVIIDSLVATVLRCFITLVLGHIIVNHHSICLALLVGHDLS